MGLYRPEYTKISIESTVIRSDFVQMLRYFVIINDCRLILGFASAELPTSGHAYYDRCPRLSFI